MEPEAPKKPSLAESLNALSLLAQFLGLIERVLPAFLVAWNNQLRQRAKESELRLDHAEAKLAIEAKKNELEASSQNERGNAVQEPRTKGVKGMAKNIT